MTSNGVMTVTLHHFTDFGSFRANYVLVVKVRPIMCVREK